MRCPWCGDDPLYVSYHDNDWGRLVVGDERRLFEFLVLESAQAGLSWLTILRKREGYRTAFLGFYAERVAAMTVDDVNRLMHFAGIVRNRRKIEAAITNARLFIAIQKEFGSFDAYVRTFLPDGMPVDNHPVTAVDVPAVSDESAAMSEDMRRRGFKFFGPTICYSFLEATGYINDHIEGCLCRGLKDNNDNAQ